MLGQIALLLFAGYRYGFSLISSAFNYHGMSWQEIRVWSHKNPGRILGFGIASYILLLIPFAILFVLPGITLGGILLYHDYQEEQEEQKSPICKNSRNSL